MSYEEMAKKIDDLDKDFALWYLLHEYTESLDSKLQKDLNPYERFVIKRQLEGLNLTVDILAKEVF